MNSAIDWLMNGPAWIKYRTMIDLKDELLDNGSAISARLGLLEDPRLASLITDLAEWPGMALKRHNDAGHLLHKLVFISDLGFCHSDLPVEPIVLRILQNQSQSGAFQVKVNVARAFGGSGQDVCGWALCDSPSILYSLSKMGLCQNHQIQKAAGHLAGLATADGWSCVVSPEMGNFRGPGRKADPCPYATLIALKTMGQLPEWKDHIVCHQGAETLLKLWEQRRERRPYLFGMGTDFVKLKAPLVWYDILHVTEVLTQFPWLLQDKRLREMLAVIIAKADSDGRFSAESIWKAWSGWDFGQKKAPSPWITFLVLRTLKRARMA